MHCGEIQLVRVVHNHTRQNLTLRGEITLERVEIIVVSVVFTFVFLRVKITFMRVVISFVPVKVTLRVEKILCG
jgi:hypothetical protein